MFSRHTRTYVRNQSWPLGQECSFPGSKKIGQNSEPSEVLMMKLHSGGDIPTVRHIQEERGSARKGCPDPGRRLATAGGALPGWEDLATGPLVWPSMARNS